MPTFTLYMPDSQTAFATAVIASPGFLQSGTGAVTRTMLAKVRERISVTDFAGVDPTGAQDSSSGIQAAVTYCKANPGVTLFFPRGVYKITSSIDCTYSGAPAGLSSGYYGFTVEGEDSFNTVISCRTPGKVGWDCTGKPRMQFRNICFANYTNDASNPSCLLLLARNTGNDYGGGHLFDRVIFRGYVTQTLVQTASSEVNVWRNCEFEAFGATSVLELTDQIDTTVNSEYIDLSAHTFAGGNTRHVFIGCAFNAYIAGTGTRAVNMALVDNALFLGCYSNSDMTTTFGMTDDCYNVSFVEHRDESESTYFLTVASGVTLFGFSFTGRCGRPIRGENTSVITRADIRPTFIATTTTYSIDCYDLTDSDVRYITNDIRVRNDAHGSRFHDKKQASEWSLPTGDLTSPEFYWLSYTGGSINYTRKVENQNKYKRHELGRMHISRLVIPTTEVSSLSAATYASGYTPDLDVASSYNFTVTGNATVNAPANSNLGPNDPTGQIIILTFCQNATGGYTVTLPADYDFQGATIPTAAFARVTLMFIAQNTTGGFKWVKVS